MSDKEYTLDGALYRPAYTRAGTKFGRATAATLDEAGESLLTATKSKIASLDPNGTALKFAFITDLHRSEDGIYVSNPIDDRYSLRLLSRLCDDVDFDAVFCGGDITNARDENADYFQENMADVTNDFDDLMPYTNVYATVGNHDKRYSTSRPNTTNAQLKALWADLQTDGNHVELHYIDDTNFYVDFMKHKVRFIFINQYDDVDSNNSWYANENITSDTGIHTHGTTAWKSALPTTDKANWLVGVVYHGADNSNPSSPSISNFNYTDLKNTLQSYITGGGRGVIGVFAGHYHSKQERTILPNLNIIHVANAYASSAQVGSADAYCFSIVLLDSSSGVFHEISVGRDATTAPFCAMFGSGNNNGLLENGTYSNPTFTIFFCVYNSNHVRFAYRINQFVYGFNLTNLAANYSGNWNADHVTSDTENTLFSAQAGDIIKTEIKFSSDTIASTRGFKIFSPQISDMVSNTGITPGQTYTKEVTLAADTNITAIGFVYYGQTTDADGPMDFELNVYKNGVKIVRQVET